MYKIKSVPEDFVVKEISNVAFGDKGQYAYYLLKKRDYNTLDIVKLLSKKLGVAVKDIGFAGSKDKKAVTEQVVSLKGVSKGNVSGLVLKDVSLDFLGCGAVPVCLGDLLGNYFEIVVRNLDSFDFEVKDKVVNYFDSQRFGTNNVGVGKGLVRKDFKEVCSLLKLPVEGNDYIKAIRVVSKRLLLFYVHAYQSFIWNGVVKEVVDKCIKADEVPLIGFGTDLEKVNDNVKVIIEDILTSEGVKLDDFVIRQIPSLSLEGDVRKVYVAVDDFKVLEEGSDELNAGKKKVKIAFSLVKGSYATRVVKEMF